MSTLSIQLPELPIPPIPKLPAHTPFGTTCDDTASMQIIYPGVGNNSQFSYDGIGRCVKIAESRNNILTSTKQFLLDDNFRCEERDASGSVTKQFYKRGEIISGTGSLFTKDITGSVRELTNTSGTIVSMYCYDPFGVPTYVQGSVTSDFQYAGYYLHQPSGLNLVTNREYSPLLGRWLSRDPADESDGVNLYAYVRNAPIAKYDPLGTRNVDINKTGRSDDLIQTNAPTDVIAFASHGDNGELWDGTNNDKVMDLKTVAELINAKLGSKTCGRMVYVMACHSGEGHEPAASVLARHDYTNSWTLGLWGVSQPWMDGVSTGTLGEQGGFTVFDPKGHAVKTFEGRTTTPQMFEYMRKKASND